MAGRLCLTGVVRIEEGSDERVLHGAQPRLLLVRAALDPRHPVPADELAVALWPDAPRHSEGALRGVVAKVRAFLDDEAALENTGRCYRFLPGSTSIDVDEAVQALDDAELAADDGRWADAVRAADTAATLLADPLLPGVDSPWLEPWRTRLQRRCCRARRTGAAAQSALGHHDRARDLAEAAVTPDPFDERSHRTLMSVLLAGGNRSEALRAYGRLRELLADELGVDPDAETQSIYEQAVTGGGPVTGTAG